ncbi:hypothetical protein CTRI78_v004611 [Colletotrichum trifolii]|uniref:Transcription factor domain-containing protein n=1 Tax=Colletotrichum trifolii TaxID=5466 RepID=A0A4R8RTA2_COLTR|nr:hypothetical protein CTRI78_v004611 [Colletotrichum trifolii]
MSPSALSDAKPDANGGQARFVGDLNPEGMFAEAADSDSAANPAHKADVGVWLQSGSTPSGQASSNVVTRPTPMLDKLLLPHVREICLACVPPERDFKHLHRVYREKIHPIFAIVPEDTMAGDAPAAVLMRQVVSLAAATDPEMKNHLRLMSNGPKKMSYQDFSQQLSGSIRTILETKLISDRTVHIRALCMLSLYIQPSEADETDLPALLGAKAVHHCQTLGLQLFHTSDDASDTLFCAVWALDHINAAAYGRPSVLHERDIGPGLEECFRRQAPCFRLFLSVVQWLDKVIELYRPGVIAKSLEAKPFIDLPVLEPMILEAGALEVPTPLLATIEVFYHAVIILSCRLPRPGPPSSYAQTIPPASANARRSLAAERISSAIRRDHLSPVPLVPYALSLALSVEYRKMRHSALPMFRARARSAFKSSSELMKRFGDVFWSARVVASLGERILREMERAATSLAQGAAISGVPPPSSHIDLPNSRVNGAPGSLIMEDANMSVAEATATADVPPLNSVDFSVVDSMPHLDVFGHFDPSFNLPAVDNALEANLDIGLPLNWGDWDQFLG